MVTFQKIYEDAMSTFPGDIRNFDPVTLQNWINESYIEIRDQFIQANRHEQFATRKTITSFKVDRDVPYLKYGILAEPILEHTNLDSLIIYAICRKGKPIKDIAQTWSIGDLGWIGENLYEAVGDIDNVNTFSSTFKNCDVRNYAPTNGLKYKIGDIVKENNNYYRAIEETVNTFDTALSTRSEWEQVFWKYKGIGFVDPEIVNFSLVDRKKTVIDGGATIMSFDRQKAYVSHGIDSVELSYVPAHTWKTENDDEFQIPQIAISTWRNLIHERMFRSRGQTIDNNE